MTSCKNGEACEGQVCASVNPHVTSPFASTNAGSRKGVSGDQQDRSSGMQMIDFLVTEDIPRRWSLRHEICGA